MGWGAGRGAAPALAGEWGRGRVCTGGGGEGRDDGRPGFARGAWRGGEGRGPSPPRWAAIGGRRRRCPLPRLPAPSADPFLPRRRGPAACAEASLLCPRCLLPLPQPWPPQHQVTACPPPSPSPAGQAARGRPARRGRWAPWGAGNGGGGRGVRRRHTPLPRGRCPLSRARGVGAWERTLSFSAKFLIWFGFCGGDRAPARGWHGCPPPPFPPPPQPRGRGGEGQVNASSRSFEPHPLRAEGGCPGRLPLGSLSFGFVPKLKN